MNDISFVANGGPDRAQTGQASTMSLHKACTPGSSLPLRVKFQPYRKWHMRISVDTLSQRRSSLRDVLVGNEQCADCGRKPDDISICSQMHRILRSNIYWKGSW